MDDDWDLHAVVRGYASASAATTRVAVSNDSFPSFSPGPLNGGQNSYDFPKLEERKSPCQGLKQIYKHFYVDPSPPPPPPAGAAISVPSVKMQTPLIQMDSSPKNLPALNTQPVRPRRSKNQQMKLVREMTQEELSADSWAWRKYGQKPIKGSPYPRNYYRCSTSKICAARKQVERSPNDPALFVVSYTGEHTHPRPAYRSSLSGSTRSKLAAPPSAAKRDSSNVIITSSPPAAGLSFSPSTPLVEGEAAAQNDDVEVAEEEEEDDMIMIFNDEEDVFKGFQDSDGGGEFFSSGSLLPPPPSPPSAAEAVAEWPARVV